MANKMVKKRKVFLCDRENPLVSVRVHNYNYGRFLKDCIDSILNQTYPNLEICFSDNASEDESWGIIQEYQRQYPDLFNIACNRINFGPDANIVNCIFSEKGKYSIQMCSDDVMAPDFIEKSVRTLEKHSECAFVIVHRGIINENGTFMEEPPFYNQSCIIKGAEQAAVYMMAAVNPSISQIVYVSSKESVNRVDFSKIMAGRWYGARIMDFNLCCNHPIAYLKDPLLLHRLHGENDSAKAAGNLIEILGPFMLHHQFADIARSYGMVKAVDRLPDATVKLSQLCLRYSAISLIAGNNTIGEQYYHLALALSLSIKEDKNFNRITTYLYGKDDCRKVVVEELRNAENLVARKISYDCPPDSIKIEI